MSSKPAAYGFLLLTLVVGVSVAQERNGFPLQYVMNLTFCSHISFGNISDIAVNEVEGHVLILQRSYPAVIIVDRHCTLLYAWHTEDIGYPHSIKLHGSGEKNATIWITDMAGTLSSGDMYGHCIKEFTYQSGIYIRSIGKCGKDTAGSGVDPPQFDRVTDIAWNSKGYYYVTDGDINGLNNRVLVFDSKLNLVNVWNKGNQPGSGPLQFRLPHRLIADECDRLWIVDTQNYRVQIIDSNGTFLGQWRCFNDSLLYGIDLGPTMNNSSYLLLTALTSYGNVVFSLSVNMDCSDVENFGHCSIDRQLVFSKAAEKLVQSKTTGSPMLHTVTIDKITEVLYFAMLPGSIPPLTFFPAESPPESNLSICSTELTPPQWQDQWNAAVLLTPFTKENLATADIEYSDKYNAMYVHVATPHSENEYLIVGNGTFTIQHNTTGRICTRVKESKWKFPQPDWLQDKNCSCEGYFTVSGIKTLLWQCPERDGFVNRYYFHSTNKTLWRALFMNNTNPNLIPVFGKYSMVHFTSYGTNITSLEDAIGICMKTKHPNLKQNGRVLNFHKIHQKHRSPTNMRKSSSIFGFSYSGCEAIKKLPSWPEQTYMTVTMLPVDNYTPFPGGVLYDWSRVSQRTMMMFTPSRMYNSYQISNSTYTLFQDSNKSIECQSHLGFGPVEPNWMTKDNCKCMGTISRNVDLSPGNLTVIAVCPLEDTRVFWTWFTQDTRFLPLLFYETSSPVGEGTSLALADYDTTYPDYLLIDLLEFRVPKQCVV